MTESDVRNWLELLLWPGLSRRQKHQWLQRESIQEILSQLQAGHRPSLLSLEPCGSLPVEQCRQRDQALAWLTQDRTRWLLPLTDNAYPDALRNIDDPPLALFGQGQSQALSTPCLAMVGSRSASASGRTIAHSWASQLVQAGWCVVSGLALGIDGACHQGALAADGQTVAVLGSGLTQLYPRQHQALAERIVVQGALVSEYFPTQKPLKHHFPQRNRIVSGLSYGLVVLEASLKSGSLISARLAAEQGREVFAVPGSVFERNRDGCHRLIQQGAKLVMSPNDIVEELAPQLTIPVAEQGTELPVPPLLDSVGFEVTPVDVVVQRSGLPVETVAIQLIELELDGWVRAVPQGYIRLKGG
ncbi:MAG: DNA-processing protein DprA [Ferrimonas sp.]